MLTWLWSSNPNLKFIILYCTVNHLVIAVQNNPIIVIHVTVNKSEIKFNPAIDLLVTMRLPCANITLLLLYGLINNVGLNRDRDHPPGGNYKCFYVLTRYSFRQSGSGSRPRREHTSEFHPAQFVPNHILYSACESWTTGSRAGPEQSSSRLMFDTNQPNLWGSDASTKKLRPKVLVHAMSGQWPNPQSTDPRRDEKLNIKFLRNNSLTGSFKVLKGESVRRLWGAGAPVLDQLYLHSSLQDTWGEGVIDKDVLQSCTENRGVSMAYLDQVDVRELVMGVSSNAEIEEVYDFIKQNIQDDYRDLAVLGVSLDCEEVRMCTSDYDRFTGNAPIEPQTRIDAEAFKLKTELPPGESWLQVPVKIMLGNGTSYAVMITAEVAVIENNETGEIEQWARRLEIQPQLVKLLHDLPTAYGLGIKSDIMEIERLVKALTGKPFEMDDFIDLAPLAVAAGYNRATHNMTVLAYELIGGVLNKHCSRGDGKWGLTWKDIPPALKVYALADLKFGYQALAVLYAVLIKNLFPDPDIVLAFTRASHREFGVWFGSFLVATFKGVELKVAALQDAVDSGHDDLEEFFGALRCRLMDEDGRSRLSAYPPDRVLLLLKLYGAWPSVTQGGCKFLIQARAHFVTQYELLTSSAAYGWKDLSFPVTEEMREAAVYGTPRVRDLDFTVPTKHRIGLGQHPHRTKTLSRKAFGSLTSADVEEIAGNGKSAKDNALRRELVYESARLNFHNIKEFVENIPNDPYFMSWVRSYYLEVQNINFRATGCTKRYVVDELKELLLFNTEGSIQKLLDQYESVQRVQEQRVVRIQHLQDELERIHDPSLPLSKLTYRGQLPPLGIPNPSYKKSSRRDLENPDLNDEISRCVPAVFGENETPYIGLTEFFPMGRAPSGSRRLGGASNGAGMSTLARDEVEEPSNRHIPIPDDDWEMVHIESETEGLSPSRAHDGPASYD